MTRDCPHCEAWGANSAGAPVTRFVIDGTRHTAPEVWLMGRARLHFAAGLKSLESYRAALEDWLEHCTVEAALAVQDSRTPEAIPPTANQCDACGARGAERCAPGCQYRLADDASASHATHRCTEECARREVAEER